MSNSTPKDPELNEHVRGKRDGFYYEGTITSITEGGTEPFASVKLKHVPEELRTTAFDVGKEASIAIKNLVRV